MNKNIVKLPFVENKRTYYAKKNYAKRNLESALKHDNAKYVVIISLDDSEHGNFTVRSSCAKTCQTIAMIEMAKQDILNGCDATTVITGKYRKK